MTNESRVYIMYEMVNIDAKKNKERDGARGREKQKQLFEKRNQKRKKNE